MDDDRILALERRLWQEGASAYDALLDDGALMAFPQIGTMRAAAVRASIQEAPRWDSVAFADVLVARPADAVVVIGYRAEAARAGAAPYRCLCTSTYHLTEEGWRIVQHQQSPID